MLPPLKDTRWDSCFTAPEKIKCIFFLRVFFLDNIFVFLLF